MTRADIIRMAIEAELVPDALWETPELERFAALVADAEREKCASILSESAAMILEPKRTNDVDRHVAYVLTRHAAAIRARSQQPEKHTPCAGKPTNNPPSPGAWEFYQPCHHCQRRLAQGSEQRPAPPEFIDGECPSRIGSAP
jgi:hypothetical protein